MELNSVLNSACIFQVPLFKHTAKGLKRMLSLHIKQKTYFPGQILFRENDIGQRLYYVKQGEVQVRNYATYGIYFLDLY